ncbi:hypothetical protein [Campylobacter ureolyticus]|uniref:Uncharacterized protein n=1 Tax=Campylobacter ureolyticus TaxID=827 RepID=A0AAE7JQ51_9BACT|nr:hypothetical protein [Campylobacter ureolyticus]MCR8685632.1 hypothetical protein [Campylobacter ureolyticus]MDU5326333.1 hypothetical protein [Campylobacter ureolyticus]QKF85088.1 hypothetical protein CURT_1660 [Campylobacter ureolyticus]QQY36431.1 hypothetical protein I6I59_04185 [Campylobacter ureolyticus]SUX25619.1 Uncharacterised protein [Campylobacter ureolyticus]
MNKNEIFIILRATSNKKISDIKNISFSKIWKKGDNKIAGNSILKHKNFGFEIEQKYFNKYYIQEILDDFFTNENVMKFAKLSLLNKELLVVVYSYDMFPAINYNSKFLKFLGDNDISLSHDLYDFENINALC